MPYPTTARLGLPLVPDGDTAWGPALRAAMEAIDAAMPGQSSVVIALNTDTGVVDLGLAFSILHETASVAGRFRLYRNATGRDEDLGRASGIAAPTSVGLLLEDLFMASALSIAAVPAPGAPDGGASCAWSWSGLTPATLTILLRTSRPL